MKRKRTFIPQDYYTDYSFPQEHVRKLIAFLKSEIRQKYSRGQREHGGRLWRKPCMPRAWEELLDLVTYFHVVIMHYEAILRIAHKARFKKIDAQEAVEAIYNILVLGNPEGIAEPDEPDE